jgi:hypothetical protein
MKKLQAAMRDKAAKRWNESKLYYKVGSVFKGCANCGDYEEDETESGRTKRRYTSGYQVFRSYSPKWMGWTYWCYECGAKDEKCWENAIDIGQDAIVGSRDSVRARKAEMRRDAVKNDVVPKAPSRASEIARLEAELARLMEMLKGRS